MILLWLIVAVLTLVVLALLVWPLLRTDVQAAPDRASYDLTVYRDQLAEIDRDVTRGLLTPDQAETARLEIQRRMLSVAGAAGQTAGEAMAEVKQGEGATFWGFSRLSLAELGAAVRGMLPRARAQGPWGLVTLAGIGAVLPVGALAVYLLLGSPGLPGQPYAERIAREEQRHMASLPAAVRETITDMRAQVEKDPDNPAAWLRLGRAYRLADEHDKAVDALERARALGPEGTQKAAVLSDLAESLILTHDGVLTDRIRSLFLDALRASPDDPRARFYLGVAAVQAGKPEMALAIWRDLSESSQNSDPWVPMLRQNLALVAEENGISPDSVQPLHPLRIEAGEPVVVRDVPPPDEMVSEDIVAETSATGSPAPDTQSPDTQSTNNTAGAETDTDGSTDNGAAADRVRAAADAARPPGQGFNADEQTMIEGMVESLAARLEKDPDDLQGWQQLARSYRVLGRLDEAAEAMGRAAALAPNDVQVLSGQAETLIAAARARGAKEPPPAIYQIYAAILKQQPDNPNALYFVGREAAEVGNTNRARELWGRLLQRIPPDEPAHASLRQQMNALPTASD